MKDHALDGNFWLQDLVEVPRDGFALAVLVRCQKEFVSILELLAKLCHLLFLVWSNNVKRFETMIDVDCESAKRALLHLRRQL